MNPSRRLALFQCERLIDIEPLTKKTDDARDTHYKTVVGAFLGIDLIAGLQLLTINNLDKRLTAALYCFMISIPLLALNLRALLLHAGFERYVLTWYVSLYCEHTEED